MIAADSEGVETRKILMRLRMRTGERHEFFWDSRGDLAASWKKSLETSEILKDLKTRQVLDTLSPKAKSMSKLLSYLGLVESLGVTLLDMALVLLIANKEEMHIRRGPGIMHVSTMKELRKLELAYKLHFLEKHKLGYFAKLIDRNLRNDIAHLKLEIEEDGTIRGSGGNVIDIDEVISNFWARVGTIISFLDDVGFKNWLEKKVTE